MVLVLDCLVPHDFSTKTRNLINLQHHVIREKKLSEKESLVIFHSVVSLVCRLHKANIVHRDLKLGNIVLDKRSNQVRKTMELSQVSICSSRLPSPTSVLANT